MYRRTLLAGAGSVATASLVGCLDSVPGVGLDTEFEAGDPEYDADEPPDVIVEGDTVVVVRGIEATHSGGFAYVAVTEHQLHAETYSTTVEV
ncbi:MAG: hypothetical protein QXG03_08855 [Halalkalicoccus sp.]